MDAQNLTNLQDSELLERYCAGQVEAFEVLLQRYQGPLFNFVVRSVGDAATAEDLVQDAFTRIIQNVSSFRHESKFSTWLYRITRNLCIDHARRMRHRRHRSLDVPADRAGEGAPLSEQIAIERPSGDSQADASALRGRIAQAVEALPDEQREVFLMRQVQHLPYAEIGVITGSSENTAKSRMRYALLRLQEVLADVAPDSEAIG